MDGPIVVGTDGSETASRAVTEAIRLALAFEKPLHIVSAYRPAALEVRGLPSEFADSVHASSVVEGILAEAAARARVASVSAETHAVEGDAADAIIDVAERLEAGVIVVGNKGIGSVKRFVLGNVPSKVVHHSPCSTYIVRTT
jgi:nucleotide-binding universal stress UspA family protein